MTSFIIHLSNNKCNLLKVIIGQHTYLASFLCYVHVCFNLNIYSKTMDNIVFAFLIFGISFTSGKLIISGHILKHRSVQRM